MFGKKFSEYLQFQWWVLLLIAAAFVIRLGMSLAGMPNAQSRWVSVTIAMLVGLVYYGIAVHPSGFGSYKQLFGLLLIQSVFAQWLIALAIVLGIVTGNDNIFTAPEYSGGGDGKNWLHVSAHFIGAFLLALISWGVASLFLLVSKKVSPKRAA